MSELIYFTIASLDGYIEDEQGRFDWAEPDEDVHAFVNDLCRPVGTFLYGRRMYETMAGWETDPSYAAQSPVTKDFAEIWQAADKVVYSTTLDDVTTSRTRLERTFDPDTLRAMKAKAKSDLSVGGPGLAAHTFRAGLVDRCQFVVVPIMVGGGKRALPTGVRRDLELREQRRFGGGVVYLDYRLIR